MEPKVLINKSPNRTDKFEVVTEWPWGYRIWNIGRSNFPFPNYLPLAQESSVPYHVNLNTLKALYVDDEGLCKKVLKYAGFHGCNEEKFKELKKEYYKER